jgi:aryl-alcohol dehydrogenase-like predicted oxidoreductase
MNKVKLGISELLVTNICLGTMYFGVKIPERESFELMDIYYEEGGRFFDTANKYATWIPGYPDPVGELTVGKWINERNIRNDVVIATKMGFSYHDVPRGLTRDLIIQEVEKSLKRLNVEAIDLLYAHADYSQTPQEEALSAFHDLITAGKIKAIGASNFYTWRLATANMIATSSNLTPYSCIQTRLSILWPKIDADFGAQIPATVELLDYAKQSGVKILCFSPLLQGCFGRKDRDLPATYDTEDNRDTLRLINQMAKEHNTTGNSVVLAWMLSQDLIPVIAGSTREQIKENISSVEIYLSDSDIETLNSGFYPKVDY